MINRLESKIVPTRASPVASQVLRVLANMASDMKKMRKLLATRSTIPTG